jgi:hypothetical protein
LRSCYFSRSHSCCSKLAFLLHFLVMFLLLQAWVLVVLLGHVLATPTHIQVLFFLVAFFYSNLHFCYS